MRLIFPIHFTSKQSFSKDNVNGGSDAAIISLFRTQKMTIFMVYDSKNTENVAFYNFSTLCK